MGNTSFQFKQFTVEQSKVAMKVNTDGVLLGAWADVAQSTTILDIGTGTGVIALMTAQKNLSATIDAIDLDEDAFLQTKENFERSSWHQRLNAIQCSVQNYSIERRYDVIISNPPYFIDDFKTSNEQKNIAKHSTALTYEELISGISRLLSVHGKAFLSIPVFNVERMQRIAAQQNLFSIKLTEVIAVEGKLPYLALMQLTRQQQVLSKSTITIKDGKGAFTSEYIELTKDFYLKF